MARPRKHPLEVARVRCLWGNVWTSKGKLLKGMEAELPADEAAELDARDAVKIVKEAGHA